MLGGSVRREGLARSDLEWSGQDRVSHHVIEVSWVTKGLGFQRLADSYYETFEDQGTYCCHYFLSCLYQSLSAIGLFARQG